mmetsp:Transcript_10510/g.24065  ORF Transcript_10510/g.24065 Transcript_10510/m.24065 type:complete len:122 (-) Transcript_10510:1265-1630(-)
MGKHERWEELGFASYHDWRLFEAAERHKKKKKLADTTAIAAGTAPASCSAASSAGTILRAATQGAAAPRLSIAVGCSRSRCGVCAHQCTKHIGRRESFPQGSSRFPQGSSSRTPAEAQGRA